VSLVPSKRIQRAATGDAWSCGPRTLCRVSCEGVCKLRTSDLHDLSHRRAVRSGEAVSKALEFWNALRSRAAPEHRPSRLCQLSPAVARWRRALDPGRIQCAHKLLWLSLTARAIKRPRHFFVWHLPSAAAVRSCKTRSDGRFELQSVSPDSGR
jgi:hypothetical protein